MVRGRCAIGSYIFYSFYYLSVEGNCRLVANFVVIVVDVAVLFG